MPVSVPPEIRHLAVEVDGVNVFYREVGPPEAPTLLLLHGFPSGSHQFRRLLDALGHDYRLVAPDLPGFGNTEVPDGYRFSFDSLAATIEGFITSLDLAPCALYVFDFGGPVAMRIATRHPEWFTALVVQNANVSEDGLTDIARAMIANQPGLPGAEDRVRQILELAATRGQYLEGAADPALVAPDGWLLDQWHLELPGRKQAQVDLAFDYASNVARYPEWQDWLRRVQPPTLVLWGRHDPFFGPAGAEAYAAHVPDAEVHLLDTGHFALEESLPVAVPLIDAFLAKHLGPPTPLRLAVVGGHGRIGSVVADEATSRGHRVARLGSADLDATDPESWRGGLSDYDAVVLAVKGPDRTVERAVGAALKGLGDASGPRLVVVGGGGSLRAPNGERFVDLPGFPREYLETARDQATALDLIAGSGTEVPWTYVSPPPKDLVAGPASGHHHLQARDTPLLDGEGRPRATVGDLAAAVVDLAQGRHFLGERVAVATLE
ncbi:pimeloyl-ACP methyl ester carboxylesterase/putative NADH-flavin reductase [Nocardioides thalensis]|uniref:Pimeloyl-ACP methyl ester carboxylesterase/putative NADH-flavin reductase n=1 Tax=Nocardioides thalensis TaxID=1914755 RepID=A0A853BZ06_9ACTN|nr:alpha/beta fold hydrolase [Nocardioides thalensis]NYJ00274.1 pimeloyl-ACP methyl ester carboxylesterase/putative NADH-flavin reductase [Nocardioides thalensis]